MLLVAAVYWPALGFDFVRWDDPVNVTQNPLVTEPWSAALLQKLFNGDTALRFKPLTWLVYRGLYADFGFNPAAWHALSLLLHLGATLLFWRVLRGMLGFFRPQASPRVLDWAALFGAAAWAVHPVRVEPACWVTATPYALLAIFLLASFCCYSRAAGNPDVVARRKNYALAWVLALLGYATYPVGVTYGLWLVVADLWLFRTAPDFRRGGKTVWLWLGRHAAFFLPAVASMLITFSSTSTTPWLYPAPPSFAEVGLLVRLKMGAAMLAAVGTHFVWPVALTPNNPILTVAQAGGPTLAAFAVAALAVVAAAWLLRKRRPHLTGAILGASVLSLPIIGLLQWPSWSVADRHMYLPHLVLTGALVLWAVPKGPVSVGRGRAMVLAGLVLVAGLGLLARRQVMIWRNTDTLFTYIAAQPAFAWNPHQQAYIDILWAEQARENGRETQAREKTDQARQALQAGLLVAAGADRLEEAVDYSEDLENRFGLPPQLRLERARWQLRLGHLDAAEADIARLGKELPGLAEVEALLRQSRRTK